MKKNLLNDELSLRILDVSAKDQYIVDAMVCRRWNQLLKSYSNYENDRQNFLKQKDQFFQQSLKNIDLLNWLIDDWNKGNQTELKWIGERLWNLAIRQQHLPTLLWLSNHPSLNKFKTLSMLDEGLMIAFDHYEKNRELIEFYQNQMNQIVFDPHNELDMIQYAYIHPLRSFNLTPHNVPDVKRDMLLGKNGSNFLKFGTLNDFVEYANQHEATYKSTFFCFVQHHPKVKKFLMKHCIDINDSKFYSYIDQTFPIYPKELNDQIDEDCVRILVNTSNRFDFLYHHVEIGTKFIFDDSHAEFKFCQLFIIIDDRVIKDPTDSSTQQKAIKILDHAWSSKNYKSWMKCHLSSYILWEQASELKSKFIMRWLVTNVDEPDYGTVALGYNHILVEFLRDECYWTKEKFYRNFWSFHHYIYNVFPQIK